MKYLALASFLLLSPLSSEQSVEDRLSYKQQILYLAQKHECEESLRLYKEYKEDLGRHDFEILEQIALTWIEQSATSKDPQQQLLGIFGIGVAGLNASIDILEQAIGSPDPLVQSAAIGFLGRMQEDFADLLLNKAMSSPHLQIRLEAAFLLAERKAKSATGQIEALMHRLPPEIHFFFPEFFAKVGTPEAIHVLRHLMDSPSYSTKANAILCAARYGRDDLLPPIRAAITHPNHTEQEASAAALGYLKDMRSTKKLKKLLSHPSPSVQLASAYALHLLGDDAALSMIDEEAKRENPLAICLLADLPGHEEVLLPLLTSASMQTRFNASITLLHKKDPRCLQTLLEFLIKDTKDLGFQPQVSSGGALKAWKVIASLQQNAERSFFDLKEMSMAVREFLIHEALELPEPHFLALAHALFEARQNESIPVLVSSLEQLGTPGAVQLLKRQATKAGAPLIRAYCNLALFRLDEEGPYQEAVTTFLRQHQTQELIRFRAQLPWNVRLTDQYHLTPEESSSLLILGYESLAAKKGEEGIDLLLEALSTGNPRNRPVLCGILIHTLQ